MKKNLLITVISIFLSILSNAQSDAENLTKYWHYRYRLDNYFMVVGEKSGMSMPADIRNRFGNVLDWGEGPVYLGYYIGVLATEYRLLKDNNQNTDRTLTQLYYAINAAVRIDYAADCYSEWGTNHSCAVNGFLIRDDVPASFVSDHYNELNLDVMNQFGMTNGLGVPGRVESVSSSYADNDNGVDYKKSAVSQDVIYSLLMGFALVKRFVDDGPLTFSDYVAINHPNYVTNTNIVKTIDIKNMAIDEAHQIVSYFKFNHNNHWEIKDPNGAHVVGGNGVTFAYALARAGNYITGQDYTDGHEEADEVFWIELQDPNILLCQAIASDASAHEMAMVLAAMSNSWRDGLGANADNTTPIQILVNGDYDADHQPPCEHWASHYGWDVFYGALWDVFYGSQNAYISDLCKARTILNSAPLEGPFYHNPDDNANLSGYPGWCATRRFFDDEPRQDWGKSDFEGNYNGLDYMLLFNLYYLDSKYQTANAPTFNIPGNASDHYPYMNPTLEGTFFFPREINATSSEVIVNQLSVTSTTGEFVGIPGHLTIRSGPQGTLLTNTTVEQGAYLYVAPGECIPPQSSWYFDQSMYLRVANPNINNEQIISADVNLFPNPSSSTITITFPPLQISPKGQAEPLIQIFNSQGKIVFEEKNSSKQNMIVDVSEFAEGIYFVRITDGDKVYYKKFIRE